MRRALALLFAGLALAAPALAQFPGTPKPEVEAEAHIFSAFTSGADPRVLAERVTLGPALREQLGADAERGRVYDSLVALVAAKPLRTRSLSPDEAATHASLPGVKAAEPLVMLEAGDVRLLLQYAPSEKNVAFVEQLAGTTIATPAQAPKAERVVEVPLPTEPPPPPPVAAPPVAAPPAAAAAPRVASPPAPAVAVQKPATAALRAQKPRPRGECVIKPVMSEDDLWNCSAPGQASIPQMAAPPPVAAQPAPPQTAVQATPQRECVIKPVMSEEDLRACGARR